MRPVFAPVLLVFSLGSPSARADYAVSCFCGGDNDVRLYYVDQNQLVRATCDANSTVYDRSTCDDAPTRVPFGGWLNLVDTYYAQDMNSLLRRRDEALVNQKRVEVKINEYLARETPTVPVDDLEARLGTIERQRAALVTQAQDLVDQIARMRERLGQTPNPDLQRQLADLVGSLQDNRTAVASLDGDSAALRRQLVAAYTTLGEVEDFQTLNRMWNSYGMSMSGLDVQIKEEMLKQARAANLIGHVLDQTFTWTQFNYSRGSGPNEEFAAKVEGAFRQLDPRDR